MKSCLLVAAQEGDAHPLGALPVGTLVNNVESEPGRGAQYIRAAGMAQMPPASHNCGGLGVCYHCPVIPVSPRLFQG